MSIAFNKVRHDWIATDTPEELGSDWIVDPIFDDKERAMLIGPRYWTYSGSNIHALTEEEVNSDPSFLIEAKTLAKSQVNEYRNSWMNDYFTYDNKQWDCNDEAVTNIISTLLIGLVSGNYLPEGFIFRDHNNNNHEVIFMYMVYMAISLMVFKKTVYGVSWYHKAQIDALTTVAAVKAYDFSTAWPTKDA